MNVYDTVNRLAQEIKQSEEYVNYKMAKETIKLNQNLYNDIQEFEKIRYEVQLKSMETGKTDEELLKKMQDSYSELMENPDAKKYFDAEMKFNILIADVNKIIGESIQDVMR